MLYAEIDYSFEVEFDIVMSWHDTSIFRRCNGVNPWATDPVPCPEVWRPTIGIQLVYRPCSVSTSWIL